MKQIEKLTRSSDLEQNADTDVFTVLKRQLSAIQHPFLSLLTDITHGKNGTCAVATYALHDGLQNKPGYRASAKGMEVFMNREYVTGVGGFYKPAYGFHTLLTAEDANGASVAVDPMYATLNPAWDGAFLITDVSQLGDYYQTSTDKGVIPSPWKRESTKTPLLPGHLIDITGQKAQQLVYLKDVFSMSDAGYQALVDLVKGSV
jgi:hypothetical protein